MAIIDKVKKHMTPELPPVCSKEGKCCCQFYNGQVPADYLLNYEVSCSKRGIVNGRIAKRCYAQRSSDQELITPPST